MQLELYDDNGELLARLDDDDRPLSTYPVYDYCRLHVVDLKPKELEDLMDVSKVEKYVMTDEDYDKREDSVRAFKKANPKLFEMHPEKRAELEATQKKREDEDNEALDKGIKVGDRCQVRPSLVRGVVSFVGQTKLGIGFWVGITLDEPMGQGDGHVKKVKHFDCPPGYGMWAEPKDVDTGDYPEIDIFASDEDE